MRRGVSLLLLVLLAATLAACSRSRSGSRSGSGESEQSPRVLVGAGATLPYPLYSKWATEYARVDTAVRVSYQSNGSGAGVRQLSDGVIDFGATDEPMTEDQLRRTATKLVHVPTTIGAVVFAFNLPGERDLSLSPELAADIFLGAVPRWDDPRIRALNPDTDLPSEPVIVVHRADGSGTSAALTALLAKHNEAWRDLVGAGTSPRFPVGVGAKGNEGVTALVKATPHSIGYVELVYARQAGLPMARVRNRAGKMIAPTMEAIERAATNASLPEGEDARVTLLDVDDALAYPITALSFVLVPLEAPHREKGEALAKFLWWAVHDGQAFARSLDYAPLPPRLVARAEQSLRSLRAGGRPLLPPASSP